MSKQSSVMIIRPVINKYEDPGQELYEALSFSIGLYVKWELMMAGYKIVDLACKDANRKDFERAIKSHEDVSIIVFLGHGDKNGRALTREGTNIIDVDNIHLGEGKGMYSVCCHSAEELGQQATSKGANFYMGFIGKFLLVPDVIEPIVSYCAILGLIELLKGACPVQAWSRMQLEYKYWIDELENKQDDLHPNWFFATTVLRSNMKNSKLCISNP